MTHNRYLAILSLSSLILGWTACHNTTQSSSSGSEVTANPIIWLLTGSYSSSDESGVALYEFNLNTGESQLLTDMSGISNPSFLTYRSDKNLIYTVGEDNGNSSTINVVQLSGGENPSLKLLQTDTTGGGAPCYIALTPDKDFVFTANYLGGNVTGYALDSVGKLTGKPQIINYNTHVPSADSLTQSHLHSINFTPDGRKMIAADLGKDRLYQYDITGKMPGHPLLKEESVTQIDIRPGTGPRHMSFSKDGRYAYLIGELSGEVCVLEFSEDTLKPIQYIPSDSVGGHGSGDIHLSPDGRFLYASNRLKADGISVFAVDPKSGKLTKTGYQLTGQHPRNFTITPDGRWMLVACRDTDTVEIYGINPDDGNLVPTDHHISIHSPVCLQFINPLTEEPVK